MDVDLSVPLLLDGDLKENLFVEGDFTADICLEKWILDHPDSFQNLVRKWVQAGCQVIQTPTAGASAPRLAKFDLEDCVEEYNRELVRLTKQAAGDALVAGRISFTGLSLEPFGETSFTEMVGMFREQGAVLADAGVDFFTVEKMESISEARAAAIALRKFKKPVFLMMNVDENGETIHGGSAVNALVILQELGISAFGISGTFGAGQMKELISRMKPYAKVPLIVKPDAYAMEDEIAVPLSPEEMAAEVKEALEAGAIMAGGCCGTTESHLQAIADVIKGHNGELKEPVSEETTGDLILADTKQIYELYCDQIEFSEPLVCTVDMTDELLHLEEEPIDVISVMVDTADDAKDFAMNAHMANLPICFSAHDEVTLGVALMLYNGIAMVDSSSGIDEEQLKKVAKKYGAVIY